MSNETKCLSFDLDSTFKDASQTEAQQKQSGPWESQHTRNPEHPSKRIKKSNDHCCVPECEGDARYDSSLSFHRIPKNNDLRKIWISKIRRDEGDLFKITNNTRVCSKHFSEEDFLPTDNAGRRLLKQGAFPHIFTWKPNAKVRRKIIRHVERSSTETHDNVDVDMEENQQPEISSESSEIDVLREQLKALELELKSTKDEYSEFKTCAQLEIQKANLATKQARDEIEKQEVTLKIYKFGVERFTRDNSSIKFYTGFPTYEHLIAFYEFVKPSAENMTYCYASGVLDSRPSSRSMLLIDECFMCLVRIRLGLFQQDLAVRFNLHPSSVSRKLTTWINYLYFLLASQSIWPTREQINNSMSDEFLNLYPNTRVIIDCTELYVQTPSSLLLQSQLYSAYKSNTTLKGLVGISPKGAIIFVSNLYTGAISDREITRCSGILDL